MDSKIILIIEDEILIAFDIQESLKMSGFKHIFILTNSVDAIRIASEIKPDIIISDINIDGDLDGIDTIRCIREHVDSHVIFMTANNCDDCRRRASEQGMLGYFLKPLHVPELCNFVLGLF